MKRVIFILLIAFMSIATIATSADEKRTLGDEKNPFFFEEGDMSELLEYAKSESSWQAYANAEKMADFNEEIIAKMAMAILPVDRWFPDGMYTEVYHDVESDIWLVRFGNWPYTAGGAVGIAFSGSDGRILMRWGEE